MTRARQVVPEDSLLITRRCSERRAFLKPSDRLNDIVRYLLAVGSAKYAVELVAACFMANHYHLVTNDTEGRHPKFTAWFNGMMARAVNAYRGRREALWSSEQVNVCVLPTGADVLDRAAYVLNNAVAAGVVAHGRDWPGYRSSPHAAASGAVTVRRPELAFFRKSGLPAKATLRFVVPREHRELTPQQFGDLLAERVAQGEVAIAAAMAAEGRRFAGAESVKRLVWSEAPPGAEEPLRRPFPRVSSRCPAARQATLERIARFELDHERARLAFRNGDRAVVFPFGTWQLRYTAGVRCHPPP